MDAATEGSSSVVRYMLPNGVRIEKFHSIKLIVSGGDLLKLSDWDLKQFLRKLDTHCSDPLYECVTRTSDSKALSVIIVYENQISAEELSRKIELLRGRFKINAQILNAEIVRDVVNISVSKTVWLRNLPIRWFELDSLQGSCTVPTAHIMYSFLEKHFGGVDQMETKNPKDEKGTLLQIDLCIKFLSASSCINLMNMMGARSCIAKREGASIVFPIVAELDMSDYLSSELVAQRSSLRDRVRSCRAELKRESAALSLALDDAESFLCTTAIKDMLGNSELKGEYEEVVQLCVKHRNNLRDCFPSDSHSSLDEEVPLIKSYSKMLHSAASTISHRKSSLGQNAALEQLSRKVKAQKESEKLMQIELVEVRNRAKECLLFATDISTSGKGICDKNKWVDVSQKLFPRVDSLGTTLSQLLKNQGGGAKYMGVLKKSFDSLDSYIQRITPVLELLSGFNVLIDCLEKTKSELFLDDTLSPPPPPSDSHTDTNKTPSSTANVAKDALRNLMIKSNVKINTFLARIYDWPNEWVCEGSSEQSAALKSVLEDDEVCNEEMLSKIAQAIDVLLRVHSQLQEAASVAQSVLGSLQATAEPDPGNQNRSSVQSESIALDESSLSTGALEAAESEICRARGRCQCFSGCCICDGAELTELRRLFIVEILDPYENRMSRIATLLRSGFDTLLEPSFHSGLRNAVETGCNLLQIGVEEHEQDKRELVVEAKRIEEDRLAGIRKQKAMEEEQLRRRKEENRALLEMKIRILKEKKKELEEAEDPKRLSSESQGISLKAEERCSERGERQRDHPARTDRGGSDRDREKHSDRGRYDDRYSNSEEPMGGGVLRLRPREEECEKGDHIYALQQPLWDLDPSMDEGACTRSLRCGHSYGSGDRYGGEAFVGQKRRFVLSAVGHTSAAGDNLILSALRRKLGQGGTVAVTVSVSQCSGINSSSSSGSAIHSEQGGVAGDAPVSNSFTVESLIQPDAKAEMELGCVGDVEDVKFELAVVADPLKRESFMREALLATRLKNRKLLRQS